MKETWIFLEKSCHLFLVRHVYMNAVGYDPQLANKLGVCRPIWSGYLRKNQNSSIYIYLRFIGMLIASHVWQSLYGHTHEASEMRNWLSLKDPYAGGCRQLIYRLWSGTAGGQNSGGKSASKEEMVKILVGSFTGSSSHKSTKERIKCQTIQNRVKRQNKNKKKVYWLYLVFLVGILPHAQNDKKKKNLQAQS